MKILITAGPTHEPIDAVRYIGNRSSGRMGAALAEAALGAGHQVTLIVGPVTVAMPAGARRIDVETAAQMSAAVLREFPNHDLLVMAAAVADYRPKQIARGKIDRAGTLVIECESTPDILAAAGKIKRPNQRTVGFSLESPGNLSRAGVKLVRKDLDLIVYNPIETMNRPTIEPVLLWPDGRQEELPGETKTSFAKLLIRHATQLFDRPIHAGSGSS